MAISIAITITIIINCEHFEALLGVIRAAYDSRVEAATTCKYEEGHEVGDT